MGSRLSTLATCGFGVRTSLQPAKLPSFGGYSLETLPYLYLHFWYGSLQQLMKEQE